MLNPFEITLENQADDEEIVRIWRHHLITLLGPVFRVLAFLLIPVLLLIFTGAALFSSVALFVIFVVICAITITYAAYEWVSWYGDVYVLTNYRIIDVEQQGFFSRRFDEANLGNIQDISIQVKGLLQTLFNFGTVRIQTAGASPNIDMNQVAKPQRQSVFLLRYQQEYLAERGEQEMTAEELIKLLTKHRKILDKLTEAEEEELKKKTDEQIERIKKVGLDVRRKKK